MKPQRATRQESASQRYIRLLGELEHATDSMHTGDGDSAMDVLGFAELTKADCIDGHIDHDSDGKITSVQFMSITVKGRLLLDELRNKEALSTSAGIWSRYKWAVYGGILATWPPP
jgi:hypothetical protein